MKTKNHYLPFALCIFVVVFTASCVSTKKYHASENRIKSLQADSARLEASIRKLAAEKLGIEAEKAVNEQYFTEQLVIKQEEVNAKEKHLKDRKQKQN